jgi:hypothetical protein
MTALMLSRNAFHARPRTVGNQVLSVQLRRQFLSHNTSVRPETAGPIRKVLKMNLMFEDLARDRMRRMRRDAELSRAVHRLRLRARRARDNAK